MEEQITALHVYAALTAVAVGVVGLIWCVIFAMAIWKTLFGAATKLPSAGEKP